MLTPVCVLFWSVVAGGIITFALPGTLCCLFLSIFGTGEEGTRKKYFIWFLLCLVAVLLASSLVVCLEVHYPIRFQTDGAFEAHFSIAYPLRSSYHATDIS